MAWSGIVFADTDESPRISQYMPNWLITSILNNNNQSKAVENTNKLNAIENKNIQFRADTKKSDDADQESKLPLKKKRSGPDPKMSTVHTITNTVTTNTVTADTTPTINTVLPAELYNMQYFATPESRTSKIAEEQAKGVRSIAVPGTQNTLYYWQDGNNVFYNIKDTNGNEIIQKTMFFAMSGTPYDYTYLNTDIKVTNDSVYGPVLTMDMALIDSSLKTFTLPGMDPFTSYSSLDKGGIWMLVPIDGAYKMFGKDDMSHTNLSRYDFNTGEYTLTEFDNNYGLNSNIYTSGTITSSTTISTPTSSVDTSNVSTVSYLSNPQQVYSNSKYNFTDQDLAYIGYNNISTTFQPIKYDNITKTDISNIDQLKIRDSHEETNQNDPRHTDHSILTLSFKDTSALEDTIGYLENKESRTNMEENVLVVAKILEENVAYLDEETIRQFDDVVKIVKAVEEMRGVMKESDFLAISHGLMKLVEEQHSLYNDYLKTTQKIYERLDTLLSIATEDPILPKEYLLLYDMNKMAKKRLTIDRTLRNLKNKEKGLMTDNEKEALKIEEQMLSPMREEYLSKLKMTITSFMIDIKDVLKDKLPVSVVKDKDSLKALIVLRGTDLQ